MGETARKVKFRQDTEEFFQLYALGERIGLGGEHFWTLHSVCRSKLAAMCHSDTSFDQLFETRV